MRFTIFWLTMSAIAGLAAAQDSMTDAGAGWAPDGRRSSRWPGDSSSRWLRRFRPTSTGGASAPGVRSVSEVLMHTASANYFFLRSMDVKAGEDLPKDPEKRVVAKADVVRWLKASFEAAEESYPKIDKKALKFLGHDATCEGVLLRALPHSNEHLGQMIAYARVRPITYMACRSKREKSFPGSKIRMISRATESSY